MPIDLKVIGARLKKSRETLGYSFGEASSACGITAKRLDELENGTFTPTGDEILILASLYNCEFLQLIDRNLPGPSDLTEILFRRHGVSFNKNDRRAIQEFIHLCQRESELEQMLGTQKTMPIVKWSGGFYKGHGADAAHAIRKHLNYSDNSVGRDIYSDFRALGVHIFRRKLSNEEISGVYINDPIGGHCILVNYDEDIYRQRFSVSHEVAHSIFDSTEGVMVSYEVASSRYSREDLVEIRANSFASNYLMPPQMLHSISPWNAETVKYWAQNFRVSTAALAKALRDEKIVTGAQAEMLKNIRIPKSEKIDPEAPDNLTDLQRLRRLGLLERGLSDYYVSLCCNAYERQLISTHRLAELLGSSLEELVEIGKLFGRTIKHGI